MLARRLLFPIAVAAVALAAAPPAAAGIGDDVRTGQALAARLQSGATRCANASAADFRRLGELVADRMAGSRSRHQAMDARMRAAIGTRGERGMHELMGRRYAGCGAAGASMMGSAGRDWMRDGAWRSTDRAGWQRMAYGRDGPMGPGMMVRADDGTDLITLAVWLAGVLLAGAVLVAWRPWRRRLSPPRTS